MIAAAEAQRNIAINLTMIASPGNPAVVQKELGQILAAKQAITKAAIEGASQRLDAILKELKKSNQAFQNYVTSTGAAERKRVKENKKANKEIVASVNAMSKKLEVAITRNGEKYEKLQKRSIKQSKKNNKALIAAIEDMAKKTESIFGNLEKKLTEITEVESQKRKKKREKETDHVKQLEKLNRIEIESYRKATEAGLGAMQGTMDLVEGIANLGLISEESFEKFEQGFQKVETGFKALKGFTELVWKGQEALIAMREAQEALRTSQALLAAAPIPPALTTTAAGKAALAGGGVTAGGLAVQVGTEATASAVGSSLATKKIAQEAAEEAAEKAALKTAQKTGGGLLDTLGMIAANYIGARAGGGFFKGAPSAGRGATSRIGGMTVGGALRGAGRGILGAGKGVLIRGGNLLARIGAAKIGTIGRLGGLGLAGAEAIQYGRRKLFGESAGNESIIGAGISTYGAFSNMLSSSEAVEQRQKELEKNKERSKEIRDRQRNRLSFRLSQDAAYSGLNRQRIVLGPGTDIEKAKKLELQAAAEVAQAKAAAQKNHQKQLDAMYRNEAYNDELRLMHLENVRNKQAQLVDATRARLDLLKAQNKEHENAVKSAKEQLRAAKEQVSVAEKAVANDRESKLAAFDRLSNSQKENLRAIARKKSRGEKLSFRDIQQLEETQFGREIAQKYRAQRSAGDIGTIRALGGFKDAEKDLADAKADENKKRAELAEAIRKERESRDAMIVQTERVKRSMESLSDVVDKVARVSAEQAGVEYTPPVVVPQRVPQSGQGGGSVVGAVNNATDSFVQENLALIEALRNFRDTNSESFRQLREQLSQRDQQGADYRSLLQGAP